MSRQLEKRLEIFINNLDKDIRELREHKTLNEMRNMIAESDASLVEEIKLDLINVLHGRD